MIHVGVIGYGRWGPNLARCVSAGRHCTISAICDRSTEQLARAACTHPVAALTDDWRSIVADKNIDAIVIATPAASHCEIALAALELGKHVLVEKPIARSAQEVLALINAANAKQLVLMTDHTYLYSPAVRAIQKVIKSGALGRIRHYRSVRTNFGTTDRDVDVLWDLAIHDLAIIDLLFDSVPRAVSVTTNCHDLDAQKSDAAMCVYFTDDAVARVHVGWFAPAKLRRVEIAGTMGKLLFDDLKPTAKVKLVGSAVEKAGMNGVATIGVENVEPLAAVIDHFTSCIRNRKTPLSDGTAGLRVVRLLAAAQDSVANGGRVIQLNTQHD
jgi:predicted dehydrogenase